MAKLLPCPFCGRVDEGGNIGTIYLEGRNKCVTCVCGCEGPPRAKKKDAIAAWNRRMTPEERTEERAIAMAKLEERAIAMAKL